MTVALGFTFWAFKWFKCSTYLHQLANVLVSKNFHGSNFESDARQVFAKLFLFHYFDGHLVSGDYMGGQFHLGEPSSAYGVVQFIQAVEY